jgi:hypothetical protein
MAGRPMCHHYKLDKDADMRMGTMNAAIGDAVHLWHA